MKNLYETPNILILTLNDCNIITTSGGNGDVHDSDKWGDDEWGW